MRRDRSDWVWALRDTGILVLGLLFLVALGLLVVTFVGPGL